MELTKLLEAHPSIEILGEASDLEEAATRADELQPDLIFIDVQGAEEFELLRRLPCRSRVVFVAAHGEFALRAFEVNALDYLLKPVHPDRLAETVSRRLAHEPAAQPSAPLRLDDPLILPSGESYQVVRVRDIASIKAARDHSEVTTADGKTTLVSRSLKGWESVLPVVHFLRVHRSLVVNVGHIERIEPWFNSSFRIYVKRVTEPLEVSRRYAAVLRDHFVD